MAGLISEVDAINEILGVSGDSPVTAVDSDYEQAIIARRILLSNSRSIQSKGYWFNENEDMNLLPNISGEVELPSNTINCEIQDDNGALIQRGLKIYDRSLNTFVLNKTLVATVTEFLEWDLTPQTFRQHIIALSKKQYNDEYFGSQELDASLTRIVKETKNILDAEDVDNRDINMFQASRTSNIAFSNRR